MNPVFCWPWAFSLLCLLVPAGISAAQDEIEIPQGYEDAAVAGEAPAAEEAQDENVSLLEVLAGALAEDVDPNVAQLQRQFEPQFRQLWKAELAFVQRVGTLNEEQREEMEALGNTLVRNAAKEYAVAQNHMMRGGHDPFGASSTPREPSKLIRQEVEKALRGNLTPEQTRRCQEEWDQREAHHRRVTALNLVARLDEHLVLTAEQRARLVEVLSSKYREHWSQLLELLQHNQQYLPHIPDQLILPILNPTQKTVWNAAQKQGHAVMVGGGFGHGIVVIDDGDVLIQDVEIEVVGE